MRSKIKAALAAALAAAVLASGCGAGEKVGGNTEEAQSSANSTSEESGEGGALSSEAGTSGETDASAEWKPTREMIKAAYDALAAAIPDEEISQEEQEAEEEDELRESYGEMPLPWHTSRVLYSLVDLNEDGIPELIRNQAGGGKDGIGITLTVYLTEEKETKQLTAGTALYWIPETGDFILMDENFGTESFADDSEAAEGDTVTYHFQKYHLENGSPEPQEEGSIETDYRTAEQVLKVNGEKTDTKAFLSVFDLDHAMSVSSDDYSAAGWTPSLARKILGDQGEIRKTSDTSLYMDYILASRSSLGSDELGSQYGLVDVDGDGYSELLELDPIQGGSYLFTIIDDELVALHQVNSNAELCETNSSRNCFYSCVSNHFQESRQALVAQDGMAFATGMLDRKSSDGEYTDIYKTADYLNYIILEDDSAETREFGALAEEEMEKSDNEELPDIDEILALLRKSAKTDETKEENAGSWWMQSFAATLDAIAEGKMMLGSGQSVYSDTWNLYYQLLDLDGDSEKRPELLVGYPDSFGVFTPVRGTMAMALTSADTNTAWNQESGEIRFTDMADEFTPTDIGYRVEGNDAVYVESISHIYPEDGGDEVEIYRTPDGAQILDPDTPSAEATAFETMKNDIPGDGWRALSIHNIVQDFGALPEETPSGDRKTSSVLTDAIGDPSETLQNLKSEGMTWWKQSYSMALSAFLQGYSAMYMDNSAIGENGTDGIFFQLLDIGGDGIPELLVRDANSSMDGWVVFRPVENATANAAYGELEGFDPESGTCLFLGQEACSDITWGLEIGCFDGYSYQYREYITSFTDEDTYVYYGPEGGEGQEISEDDYNAIRQQWYASVSETGTGIGSGIPLTSENVASALGNVIDPVFDEYSSFIDY